MTKYLTLALVNHPEYRFHLVFLTPFSACPNFSPLKLNAVWIPKPLNQDSSTASLIALSQSFL
jgi:hypothetical protein